MASGKSLTLSIVIPAYNEESHLKACLDALAAQTVRAEEIIVVDNNSQDGTADLAAGYAFVKVLRESRQGIVFARNTGFNAAQSDLIGRIDADTVVPRDWVERIHQLAVDCHWRDAVTGPCDFRRATFPRLDFVTHRVIYFWSSRLLFGHPILFGSNMFFFRRQWLKVRSQVCLTNNIHEDMDLSHHLAQAGGRIIFQPQFRASISNRRFHNWGRYPFMWLYSRLIHFRPRNKR